MVGAWDALHIPDSALARWYEGGNFKSNRAVAATLRADNPRLARVPMARTYANIRRVRALAAFGLTNCGWGCLCYAEALWRRRRERSEEHTSELQSQSNLVCRLLL